MRSLSLAAKMAVLSVGISGALVASVTTLGYRMASAGLRRKSELALRGDGTLTSTLVDGWIAERLDALASIARLRTVRRILETSASPAPEDVDAANESVADVASSSFEIESIAVLDLNGRTVASSAEADEGRGFLADESTRRALQGKAAVSGVTVSPTTQKPCVYVTVPSFGSNGTVVGVVRSRETVERIRGVVETARNRVGAEAEGLLLDADGLVIADTIDPAWQTRPTRPLDAGRERAMLQARRWGSASIAPAVVDADLGDLRAPPSGQAFALRVRNAAYVAASEPLNRAGWQYVVMLPLSNIEHDARVFLRRAVAGAAIGLLGAVLLSIVASRRVVRSVQRLIDISTRVVAENDLTHTIEVSSDDEVGKLARSFARMVEALRDALQTLQVASRSLLSAADELQSTTEEEKSLIARHAASLQQTQVTAQEIKQTSALAAEKASAVLREADKADAIGRSGDAIVDKTVAGLSTIQSQALDIGGRIGGLADSARQIAGITDSVKDLADQSNMLALNAAIEAVRSGEHGKGFAVVAREIRSLADQSIEATRRVRGILDGLGTAIGSAVQITHTGSRSIEEGLAQVKASGENLRSLLGIMRQNVDSARQISAAVSQQDAGIQQIFAAVTDQLEMMLQTRKHLEKTSEASAAVREQATRVSEMLQRYRI